MPLLRFFVKHGSGMLSLACFLYMTGIAVMVQVFHKEVPYLIAGRYTLSIVSLFLISLTCFCVYVRMSEDDEPASPEKVRSACRIASRIWHTIGPNPELWSSIQELSAHITIDSDSLYIEFDGLRVRWIHDSGLLECTNLEGEMVPINGTIIRRTIGYLENGFGRMIHIKWTKK